VDIGHQHVADRRGRRHRPGDVVQILPRRRTGCGGLAQPPGRRPLARLAAIREQPGDSAERLRAVLAAYGRICQRRQHGADVTAALHRDGPADDRQAQLIAIVAGLLTEAAAAGAVRRDSRPTSWRPTASARWKPPAPSEPPLG